MKPSEGKKTGKSWKKGGASGLLSRFHMTFLPNKEYTIYFNTCLLVSFLAYYISPSKGKKCIKNWGTFCRG